MNKLLKLLLLAAFFNGLLWVVLIPVWHYPDEQAHFAQVQHRGEFGNTRLEAIKTSQEVDTSESLLETKRDSFGNNKYTYHPDFNIAYTNSIFGQHEASMSSLPIQARKNLVSLESTRNPPLYYLSASVAYKLLYSGDIFTRVYAVRFVSLIFFVSTVFVAYKIGQAIFGPKNHLSFFIPATIAFLPMFVFATTGILPDPLTDLLFTTLILICTYLIVRGIAKRYVFAGLIVIVLGIFTRQHFFIAVPIFLSAILASNLRSKKNFIKLIAAGVGSIGAIFFFDRFGTALPIISNFRIPDALIFKPEQLLDKSLVTFFIESIKRTYAETLPWYWGVYRWLSFTLPPLTYQIINRLLLLAAAGVLLRIIRVARARKLEKTDLVLIFMVMATLEYAAVLTLWNYFFASKNGFPFGIQGRYYFPLITAHVTIILFGLAEIARFFKKYGRCLMFAVLAATFIFNDFSLAYLSISYYDISNINTFIIQASQYKPELVKGNIILVFIATALVTQALFLMSYLRYIVQNESR